MMTNEVVGDGDADDIFSRWFYSSNISLWEGHLEFRSYDGILDISCEDEDGEWSIRCHGGFEELEDGDLPPSITGDDIWNALGDGEVIYKIYEFVKSNANKK